MKKIVLYLFILLSLLLYACNINKDTVENNNQTTAEQQTISDGDSKQDDREKDSATSNVSSKSRVDGKQKDSATSNVSSKSRIDGKQKEQILLTYSVEKPINSNINKSSSKLSILFSAGSSAKNIAIKHNVMKDIGNYLHISPSIKGKWDVYDAGNGLVFSPNEEWQQDTKYTVTMDKAIFQAHYKISSPTFSFKTEPFLFQIKSEKINDNLDSDKVEYLLHISFNYLFNQKQFKEKAKLTLDGKNLPFKCIFDKDGYGVLVKSNLEVMEDKKQIINFSLPKISSADNSKLLHYEINHTYMVDEIMIGKSFSVYDVRTTILSDSNGNPRTALVVTFSQPVNIVDVEKYTGLFYKPDDADNFFNDISCKTGRNTVGMVPVNAGVHSSLVHSFYVDVYSDKNYYVERSYYFAVNKNLSPTAGSESIRKYRKYVTFNKLHQSVSVLQKGSLLSSKSEKKVTFQARGLHALDLEVGRILPEQVQHIINFSTSKGLGDVAFDYSHAMDTTNFAQYKNVKLPLSSEDRVLPSYATIDLNEYLGDKLGLYYVKAVGLNSSGMQVYNDNYNNYYYDDSDDCDCGDEFYHSNYYNRHIEVSRFILVTDMYIIAKEDNSKKVDVFVASISKGEPVKDAKVEVIAKNGLPVVSGQTDNNGHFRYELSKDDNLPIAIIAKKDEDFSYIPFSRQRDINYSKFDIGGEYLSNKNDLRAMIFTDRGIYRPGETIHIASIIKDVSWKKDLSGIPVEVSVISPKNEVIHSYKYSLDNIGFFDFDVATQSHFTTGIYNVSMYLLNNKSERNISLGYSSFELREFDTDTMRVNVTFKGELADGWTTNDNIEAEVKAENMYGTPAAKRRVQNKVSFSPIKFSFSKYKNYRFVDPYVERTGRVYKAYTPELKDTETNDSGIAYYNFSKLFSQYVDGSYIIEYSGEVFEKGSGDGVTGYKSIKYSPAEYLVGYSTDSYLNYLRLNEKANINFIAIDNNLNKISLNDLQYRLVEKTYMTYFIKDKSGKYRYSTVPKYNILNSGSISISDKGTDVTLPTNVNGELIYEVVDINNTVIGKVEYFVSGKGNTDSSTENEAELSLKLNKSEYKSGDTVEMNIMAPYEGYGLITIERDKVYAYKWFKTKGNVSVETIKIPEDLENNGYINVVFVRDISSKDIYSKPLSYAVMPFAIDKSKHKINMSLKVPEVVQPGDDVTIEYSADKSSKIIVYGVDEGILQVADYKLPNPLDFFMKKVALSVNTKQTADLILPDYKILSELSGIGGGEDALLAKAIANRLNPFARVVEKPVAYWSHIIDVRAGEKNKKSFTIPDHFNGSMKVMAVAVSKDGIGSMETAFISRSQIVMTPNMPYSAVAGDKFQLSLGLTNLIEGQDSATIKVTATPSKHLNITDDNSKSITLKYGEEGLLLFNVEVLNNELGSAEIVLEAQSDKLKDAIKTKLTSSIRPVTPYITDVQIGSFKGKSADIKIKQRDMYDFAIKREVETSNDVLASVSGLSNYLGNYPYGCTEQITSKIYPVVIFASRDKTINTKEVQDVFNAYIQELTKRQKGSRGFVYWSGGSYVYDLPSIYATQLLIDARELGFNVPDQLYNNAISYLTNVASNMPSDLYEANNVAYATYLLARIGTVNPRTLNVLEEFVSKSKDYREVSLVEAYMGATYILYKNEKKGNALLQATKPSYLKYKFFGNMYDTVTNISRYVYLAGRHAKHLIENDPKLINTILSNLNSGYYNSFSSAFSLAALYGISLNSDKTPTFKGNGVVVDKNNKNKATFSEDTSNIEVSYNEANKLGYYYYVTTSGFDKNIPEKTSKGIDITKSFYDKNGNKVTEGKQGDEITVAITVKSGKTDYNEHILVAFTDMIPGGTEILTKDGIRVDNFYESHEFREDRAIIYLKIPTYKFEKTIYYKIKLLSSGIFTVPPTYGEGLYNRDINAVSNSSTFIINEAH